MVASPDRELCIIKFEKEPGKLLGEERNLRVLGLFYI